MQRHVTRTRTNALESKGLQREGEAVGWARKHHVAQLRGKHEVVMRGARPDVRVHFVNDVAQLEKSVCRWQLEFNNQPIDFGYVEQHGDALH